MRIGVVCEGPSDFPALSNFFGHALQERGVDTHFLPLFPEMDKTRPEGGWANVLLWFDRYPPDARIQTYFGGGLFDGALSSEPLDAILIQLDSDALDHLPFASFVKDRYGFRVSSSNKPERRATQIEDIISLAARCDAMTEVDVARHVSVAAVEATETWCVAAFHAKHDNYELLRGADLIDAFMKALERSEGRTPQPRYSNIDKSLPRRRRFCEAHASGSGRIVNGCEQFARALRRLAALDSLQT